MIEKIAAGNWKMNGCSADLDQISAIANASNSPNCTTLIATPATLTYRAAEAVKGTKLHVAGQDCHANTNGAHTGDISANMLKDAGASFVILGHSERRADHGETSDMIAKKVTAARKSGLRPIVCIGETLNERESGAAISTVINQVTHSIPDGEIDGTVVAYEPVWAIGTGKTATPDLIAEIHNALRASLIERFGDAGNNVPLLYGGSVKAANAKEIFAVNDVNGALVGGASLTAANFTPIIKALAES